MDMRNRFQILDEVASISIALIPFGMVSSNTFLSIYGKKVGQTGFSTLVYQQILEKKKILNQKFKLLLKKQTLSHILLCGGIVQVYISKKTLKLVISSKYHSVLLKPINCMQTNDWHEIEFFNKLQNSKQFICFQRNELCIN